MEPTQGFDQFIPRAMVTRKRDRQQYVTGTWVDNSQNDNSCFYAIVDIYGTFQDVRYHRTDVLNQHFECFDLVYTHDDELTVVGYRTDTAKTRDLGLMVQLDENLNLIRQRNWGATNAGTDQRFMGIDASSDGDGFFVVGYTNAYTVGGFDNLIMKVDRNLEHRWIRTYGITGGDDQAYKVRITRNHDILYTMGISESNAGFAKPYIHRLDKWGEEVDFAYEFYGNSAASGYELETLLITNVDDEQNALEVIVCGTFNDNGDTDMFFVVLNRFLAVQNFIIYGMDGQDESDFGGCALDVDNTHIFMTFATQYSFNMVDNINDAVPIYTFDGDFSVGGVDVNSPNDGNVCTDTHRLLTDWESEFRKIEMTCFNLMKTEVETYINDYDTNAWSWKSCQHYAWDMTNWDCTLRKNAANNRNLPLF